MPRYVALLRAINVGGHTVEMKRLQRLFEALGFDDVTTFIASGNVVFRASGAPRSLEQKIAAHLERSLGYAVATFLRTPGELAAIVGHRVFAAPEPGSTLYIGFLTAKPTATAERQVQTLATDIESFRIHDRELYWRSTRTIGTSTVSGAKLEKALGQPTTLRKSTTVEKLASRFA